MSYSRQPRHLSGQYDGEFPYAWQCGQCGQLFSADGHGYSDVSKHASLAHDMRPGEAVAGVVHVDTGQVVVKGWSPQVLIKARKAGYCSDGETPAPRPSERFTPEVLQGSPPPPPPPPSPAPVADINEERRKRGFFTQQGRLNVPKIDIPLGVIVVFAAAQALERTV